MGSDSSLARRELGGSEVDSPVYTPPTLTVEPTASRNELDLERAFRILHKNWRYAAVFALTLVSVVTIVTFKMQDIYEPVARLEIDPPGSEAISLKDLLNAGTSDQDYLETQVRILQSDELAVAVIRSLRLDQNPELVGKRALREEGDQAGDESPSTTQLTRLESLAVRGFQKRATVSKVRNSRLVEVSFASHDPALAAQVTNALVNLFIDRNYRARYESTMQASEWLSGQLSDLRKKVEESSRALVDYQKENGVLNELDSEGQSSFGRKIWDLTDSLVQAQADRIQVEAALRMAEEGRAESLPSVRNSYFLQGLLLHFADSRAQLAQTQAIYGKNNPNVKKLQNEVAEMEVQITAERQKAIEELKTSYEAARRREKLATQALDDLKGIIGNMNERRIKYTLLKNDAEANQELYSDLLAKLKGAGISAGLKSSNIHVVDQARVLDKPTRPNRPLNMAFGLFAGVLGGLLFAFFVEKLDNTVHTPDDVTECTGFPSLALFPLQGSTNGKGLLSPLQERALRLLGNGKTDEEPSAARLFLDRPNSPEAEAVQNLYTSIMLSRPRKPPRVILVASGSPSEGKTTVAVNLATLLAKHGRTCLTETDLRKPAVASVFGLTHRQGLSNVLTGSTPLETAMARAPNIPTLMLLLAGATPPNPAELLASDSMKELVLSLREQFEYLVLDSPPIIPFADARSLSVLADGVIVVGRCGRTTRQAIMRTAEILESAHAHILGFVINGVNLTSPDYRYYQYGSYYGYSDTYGHESEESKKKQERREQEEGEDDTF